MSDYLIMDLQFGSTGKGLFAGYMAETRKPDGVVSNFGPNAGHTYIDSVGRKFIHKMLPMGALSPAIRHILIGPGSVVNMEILDQEIRDFEGATGKYIRDKIVIHPAAAMICSCDKAAETPLNSIGSTQQGTSAAMIRKINRQVKDWPPIIEFANVEHPVFRGITISDIEYNKRMDDTKLLQIESSQGYSLSIDSEHYPFCTSRPVNSAQIMSDCQIPWDRAVGTKIIGTLRTFPIRVANRYDENGQRVGYSGDGYPDQEETTWEEVGVKPELTTVTKLERRVFTFSAKQTQAAIRACAPDYLFLNFVNYINVDKLIDIKNIVGETGHDIRWFGYGPTFQDVLTDDDIKQNATNPFGKSDYHL